MLRTTTAERLKQLLRDRNLRQVDALALIEPWARKYNVPFFKQNLSLYLKGTVEPNQDKLILLAKAFNVSEAWLMGFDVPMERQNPTAEIAPDYIVKSGDQELLVEVERLDPAQKDLLRQYLELLKRSKQ